ncbi:thiosulfate sulfurtransferase 16, chloroplastic-like isoform X1 [Salvia miltiorrhiza]|uniref:thiosulfate sulfurtransferase 16, chloroplastic-like isoform X1 n=1 Tax=Salvia miltiorrhiza TaxID=226208 RepID=UPI0025ABE8DE|nr:thiosulfate sulfurtransferase 16, chloroplastic-like isoform X1 [Salvia miltiorrhiza]
MSSISPFSAALLPLNLPQDANTRCASLKVIKNQLGPIVRRSFSTSRRVPGFSGMVAESGNAQSPAVPTSVPVRVANELLQAGHRYLDVRTTEEFSAGHVVGAVNVPFMLRRGTGMARNPKFLEEVSTHFSKDDEIIVGCQLGKRSLMAASELVSAGFTGITDMAGGYAAWVQNGLPSTA